jgi:hypothetical protein
MSQIEQSIEVNVPVSTAYNQWTQFEDFPRFMEDISEVRQVDDTHLHWVADIGGKVVEWDAEITEQKPDERVAWKSTSGKPNAGVVTFLRLSDTSCKVVAQMDYETDGIVEKIGSVLGVDARWVKVDLESFKAIVEEHGRATGAWRGEVQAGHTTRPNGAPDIEAGNTSTSSTVSDGAHPDPGMQTEGKVREALIGAKEGFDDLSGQAIGA